MVAELNFDELIDRRDSDCTKWRKYGPDVIPLWVADMDFRSPQPVVDALRERVEHGIFGYGYSAWSQDGSTDRLRDLWRARMAERYGWQLAPEDFLFVGNVISAMHAISHTVGQPGDSVLIPTPNYWPLLGAPPHHDRQVI